MGKFDAAGAAIRGILDEGALAQKVAGDPRIQKALAKNMAGLDPALAARVRAGDPQATLEAYQAVVAAGGRLPSRQMELPLSAAEESPGTGLVPFGIRGPGVPGDMVAPGVIIDQGTELIPAPLKGIAGAGPRRLETTAGVRGRLSGPGVAQAMPRELSVDVDLPRLGFDPSPELNPSSSAGWMDWARRMAGDSGVNTPTNRRIAAGLGAALAGGVAMLRGRPTEPGAVAATPELEDDSVALTSTDGAADLAEETSPLPDSTPKVAAPIPESPAPFKHGIKLPEIPEDAVPYTVTPDVMSVAAGLGFGGTASTARMENYRDRLIERGYSAAEAEELAYLEEKNAWKERADEGLKRKLATRGQGSVDDAANVRDNLAASATPISVEPAVRKRRNMREEQIARLVSLGSTPEEAAMYVDRMIEVTGSDIDPELFDSYNTPENNESLRRSIAAGNASAARMKAFELDYNAATGHPEYGYDESGNPAKLGKVDIDKPSEAELWAKGARAYHHRAPYNSEMEARNYGPGSDYVSDAADIEPDFVDSTVPGPRTLDGRSPTPSRGLNAEEAAAYNTRPANGLSKRDSDMRERGFVPVVTPDGVSYMLAGGKGDSGPIPGGVGRRGARPDLTESGKYEEVERVGPDGKSVVVLAPTKEFKEKQEANLRERRKALAAERQARRDRWQATAMLAGGSHNLNSGNRWIANALAKMSPEQQEQAMRYMLPGGDRRAFVDAQNMENANDVIKRFLTSGAAAGMNNPMQEQAMKSKRMDDAQRWFDEWLPKNHGRGGRGGVFVGPYTASSMEQAVIYLMNRYDIRRPEAEAIAQSHGVPGVSSSPAEASPATGEGGPGGFGSAPAGGPGGF